jgi:hypothetical protein
MRRRTVRSRAHDTTLLVGSVVNNRGEAAFFSTSIVGSQASETALLVGSVVDNRGEAAFLSTSIAGSQAGETTLLVGSVVRFQASETTLFELGYLAFGLVHEQAASRNMFLYIANTSEAHWSGGNGCHQER